MVGVWNEMVAWRVVGQEEVGGWMEAMEKEEEEEEEEEEDEEEEEGVD